MATSLFAKESYATTTKIHTHAYVWQDKYECAVTMDIVNDDHTHTHAHTHTHTHTHAHTLSRTHMEGQRVSFAKESYEK